MSAGYDILGGDFDLSTEFEQDVPPYLPNARPPTYTSNYQPCSSPHIVDSPLQHPPHERHLRPVGAELSSGAGPEDAGISGFDLAESIWSRDSDLTLDELALSFHSSSSHSRSSMSSHWSAPPLTPSTSRHLDLQSSLGPLSVETPVQEFEHERPESPESPAPAYSLDPLEPDPALLASLDPQLRLRPFEAFEDVCWASLSDVAPAEVPLSPPSRSASLSHNLSSMPSCTSLTTNSAFSDTSTTIMFAPPYLSPLRPPSPSQPPPAYPTSKPLPSLPPPSPIRLTAEHTQPTLSRNPSHNSPVVMTFKSPIVAMDNLPILATTPVETVQFFPMRLQARPRSKSGSGGGTKTVQRLTTAIARLRGRE